MKPCSIPGCERPARYRGWCGTHAERWRRHGDPLYVSTVRIYAGVPRPMSNGGPLPCIVGGCPGYSVSRGLCVKHSKRMKKYGDPEMVTILRTHHPGGTCSANDCDATAVVKGLCDKHYLRLSRHGDANHETHRPVIRTQVGRSCNKCYIVQPLTEFYANTRSSDGHAYTCKTCICANSRQWRLDHPGRQGELDRALRKKNPDKYREQRLQKVYGLTLSDYQTILDEQGGGCAICGATTNANGRRLSVDHNHETGQIRGVLCSNCNTGIGHLRDSRDILLAAIAYLDKWEEAEAAENDGLRRVVSG